MKRIIANITPLQLFGLCVIVFFTPILVATGVVD